MFGGKKKKAENLMQSGSKAVGTIVGVRDTGMTINDNPRIVLSFRIDPLDGSESFAADKKATVSRVAIPQAGQRFPVWFDPADHSSFMYATIDNDQGRQQIVAMFGDARPGRQRCRSGGRGGARPGGGTGGRGPIEQLAKLNELRQAGA